MQIQSAKPSWRTSIWGDLLAEFLGTGIIIAFGAGVVAVAMAVYVTGGVSGAHLNPAVTFAFAIKGDFAWRKVLPFWIAQVLGAFVGAALVYLDYFHAINAWNLANHVLSRSSPSGLTTFSIFSTFPAQYFGGNMVGPLIDQIIGTFFLVLFIIGINDSKNMGRASVMGPFLVGMAVAAIGMSYGVDAGWGSNAFPGPNGYWWVPIVGPLVGAAIAVWSYKWFISRTLEAREKLTS